MGRRKGIDGAENEVRSALPLSWLQPLIPRR